MNSLRSLCAQICVSVFIPLISVSPVVQAQVYDPASDVVLVWNQAMLDANAADSRLAVQDQGGPTKTSRAFAIVSVAIFDAWNSIHHKYTPFLSELSGYDSANVTAAVSTAARDTLIALYPVQQQTFRTKWNSSMTSVPTGRARTRGIELGRRIAAAILADRSTDGSDATSTYTTINIPGHHRVDPLHPGQGFHAPHWGYVRPFVISNIHNWLSPPPIELSSFEYAVAIQELLNFGGAPGQFSLRSPQQTITGIFWGYDGTPGLGAPPRLYNQVVRTIAIQKRNSIERNARLFALVNVAMADAGIQCWYTKYYYDFWRPVIGIREADNDTNSFTTGDPTWRPLGAPATNGAGDGVNFTPPFPAYTSGHATFGAAAFEATAKFYGTTAIRFQFMSDEYNGVNRDANGTVRPLVRRTYNSLEEAIHENGFSRIYLGIHWWFDSTEGIASGKRVAHEIFRRAMRPRPVQ